VFGVGCSAATLRAIMRAHISRVLVFKCVTSWIIWNIWAKRGAVYYDPTPFVKV
jgi:hypothetical protein